MERELSLKLQDNGIRYLTQVELPATTADFLFRMESRPMIVSVDDWVVTVLPRERITFGRLLVLSRCENIRSATMVLVLEKTSVVRDYAYLTFRNASSSLVEITGYYIDRYKSVGVFLRILPNSTDILGVQTYLLEEGKEYSVYVTIKGLQAIEGPFKVQL